MKPIHSLLIMLTLASTAFADVIVINRPVYPGTQIPFGVVTSNVQNFGGTGHRLDEMSTVCQTLGYELAIGPFDKLAPLTGTALRVINISDYIIKLYGVHYPTEDFAAREVSTVSRLRCENRPANRIIQEIKYFSSKEVQKILKSKLPVHLSSNLNGPVTPQHFPVHTAEKLCQALGYDRSGSEHTSDGVALEGVLTKTNVYGLRNGVITLLGTETRIPSAVVCSND